MELLFKQMNELPNKQKVSVKNKKNKVDGLPKRNFGFAKHYVTITDDLFEDDLK